MSDKQERKKRVKKPKWQPQVEFFTNLSADGSSLICKTVITAIKPYRYFETVLYRKNGPTADLSPSAKDSKAEGTGS